MPIDETLPTRLRGYAEPTKQRHGVEGGEVAAFSLATEAIHAADLIEEWYAQRTALITLHEWDELVFGGFICTHCTPDDGDPDTTVMWPCPSVRAVGVTDAEAIDLINAHRAVIEAAAKANREATHA